MAVTINGVSPTTAQQREFAAAMGLPVLLQTVTVASAQQDIDFTSLDLDADRIYRIELSHIPNAADTQGVSLFYNNDVTSANYQHQFLQGASTAPTAGRFANAAISLGGTPTNTGRIFLTSITLTKAAGKSPNAISHCGGVLAADVIFKSIDHQWSGTANVTAIKLRHDNLFGVGTVAKIYKV